MTIATNHTPKSLDFVLKQYGAEAKQADRKSTRLNSSH